MKTLPISVLLPVERITPDFSEHILDKDLIRIVAKRAFVESGENWEIAVAMFAEWINNDRELYDAISYPLVMMAVKNAVFNLGRSVRHTYLGRVQTIADGNANTVNSMVSSLRLLMNYPIRNGKPLGDASVEEVLIERDFHAAQAGTMLRRSKWFELIALKASGYSSVEKMDAARAKYADGDTSVIPYFKKHVRDVLKESDLEKLEIKAGK